MSSFTGNVLKLSIFGQSHSPAIGCSLDGIPAGVPIDLERLQLFLDRRAPGRDETATARKETDTAHIISGIVDGRTCGAPISGIIKNADTRSQDYSNLRRIPRPGHADYAAYIKYKNNHDVAGGGHFSGRLTAPLCIAGGIALQALETQGIRIAAHIAALGPRDIRDTPLDPMKPNQVQLKAISTNPLPCVSAHAAASMRECIVDAKSHMDSVGGVIECVAYGVPPASATQCSTASRTASPASPSAFPQSRAWTLARVLLGPSDGKPEQTTRTECRMAKYYLKPTMRAVSSAASPPVCPLSGTWR